MLISKLDSVAKQEEKRNSSIEQRASLKLGDPSETIYETGRKIQLALIKL